jgi:REP element-mobilizing transposase RayT
MTSPSPLKPGVFYHIYNRGTNREDIFVQERNYRYFLQLYIKHIEPAAETYAYCLLKNHFHVLVRIKDAEAQDPKGLERPLGSIAFSNFFNSYAKAINKAYGRTGSLFQHPFGRIPVLTQSYLIQLVRYIHLNPQKHGLVSDFREWSYSSYQAYLSNQSTRLQRDDVLGWFDGAQGFAAAHQTPIDDQVLAPLAPEDFD